MQTNLTVFSKIELDTNQILPNLITFEYLWIELSQKNGTTEITPFPL